MKNKIKDLNRDFPIYVKLYRPIYKDTIYGCFLSPTTVIDKNPFKNQILVIVGGNLQINMWKPDDNFIEISEEEFIEYSYEHIKRHYPSVNVRKDGIKEIIKISFEQSKHLSNMEEIEAKKLTYEEKVKLLSYTKEDILNFEKDFEEACSEERREEYAKEWKKIHDKKLVLSCSPFFISSLIDEGYELEC